jgi:hypothetical protein
MAHICIQCDKKYSSYKSLWFHNYKYHNKNVTENVPNVTGDVTNNVTYKCKKCPEIFNSRQSRWRHQKVCNNNKQIIIDDKDFKIAKLEKENLETKKEMENLKNILQKSLKIHPKTLNKINNQLNNNGTINNITIIQLGQENLSEILNTRQKKNILNRQAMSLNDLVDLVHVSGKYKEFQNVYITNLQSTFAYKFDEKANKFIAVNKNELLNDLVDSRMYDIEKFYEEICPDLEPHRAEQIKRFIDRMGDEEDELKGIKKEEIKLILYNNKDKIMPKDDIVV